MLSQGYLCHLVWVNEHKVPSIESVSIENNFQDVFSEDLPGIPHEQKLDFGVDFNPNTKQISIPPYRMAQAELKVLMLHLKDLLYKGFIQPSISL